MTLSVICITSFSKPILWLEFFLTGRWRLVIHQIIGNLPVMYRINVIDSYLSLLLNWNFCVQQASKLYACKVRDMDDGSTNLWLFQPTYENTLSFVNVCVPWPKLPYMSGKSQARMFTAATDRMTRTMNNSTAMFSISAPHISCQTESLIL